MQYTLKEMVDNVLASIDGDEVNSISDTVESSQVVSIIKQNYFDIITSLDLPENYGLFKLDASTDNTKPVVMTKPSNVISIDWVKYNVQTSTDSNLVYSEMLFVTPQTFLDRMFSLDSSETGVATMTYALGGADLMTIIYRSDSMPEYYTSFDDYTLVFNAYNSTEDTILQKSKTYCYGLLEPTFAESDTFVFEIDDKYHGLLLAEAKRQAHVDLRQAQNPNAEEKARRGRIRSQKNKHDIPGMDPFKLTLPDYGRKR